MAAEKQFAAEEQFAGKSHAKVYSSYRRDTPITLIEKIVSTLKEKYDGPLDLAIDAGCGSGQSTVALAPFFKKVYGSDVSEAQIKEAKEHRPLSNVTYEVGPSETIPFEDGSVQLVSAGAALHWFKLDVFFPEVRRVLSNNGVLAVYCYYSIKPDVDDPAKAEEITKLYQEFYKLTSKYHAPQAKVAMSKYVDIDFPFEEVQKFGDVRDYFEGHLQDVVGYVTTFSGFQNLKRDDEKEANQFMSYFERRLREIVTACSINPDGRMKLFRDFYLIVCRKIVQDA